MSHPRPAFAKARPNLGATMARNAARRQCPTCGRKGALIRYESGEVVCKWNGHVLANGAKACDYYKAPKEWDA